MSAPLPEKKDVQADSHSVSSKSSTDDDNKLLEIGYVPSFKREFSNIATVCLPQSLMDAYTHFSPDQLRVQHHGALLEYRDDVQHPSHSRWTGLGDMVLDLGCLHVLHSWYVPSLPSHAPYVPVGLAPHRSE